MEGDRGDKGGSLEKAPFFLIGLRMPVVNPFRASDYKDCTKSCAMHRDMCRQVGGDFGPGSPSAP